MTEDSRSLATSAPAPPDQFEKIPLGMRWVYDAFEVAPHAGGLGSILVDMTQAKAALRILRNSKIPATMAHLIVRASALALARNPRSHQVLCNYRRITPGTVDIGLSMAGQTTYAPIVVLPEADRKPLGTLIPFTVEAVDAAVDKEQVDLANMRRWMWLVPFGFLRRFILRRFHSSYWFRKRLAGTFQISMVPSLDILVPLLYYTATVLATGALRDRVLAIDGKPVVRPTMWFSLSGDHAAIDGTRGAQLLAAIKEILESDELPREAREACASVAQGANGAPRELTGKPPPDARG